MPRRRWRALLVTALVLLAADVVSKVVVVARLEPGERVPLVGDHLFLTLGRNTGAAFSLGQSATVLFTVVAFVVLAVVARAATRVRSLPWALALGLLAGGAAGNLVDRLLRAPGVLRGAVVDWIGVVDGRFPIFNLADSAITVGGVLAVLLAYRGLDLDGTRHSDSDEPDDPSDAAPSGDGPGGGILGR